MGTGYKNRGSGAAGLGFKNRGAKLVDGAAYTNRGATDGVNEAFKNRGQSWGSDAYYNRGPNDFASLSVLGLAEFYAPLTHSLVLTRGTGDPTYSRATNAWEFDNEGKLILVPSGAARFGGARMVRNLVTYSEDFSNAAWIKIGTATVTGTNTINVPADTDYVTQAATLTINPGMAFTGQVKLSGSGTVSLRVFRSGAGTGEGTAVTITLTATPTVYTVSHTFANAQTAVRFDVGRFGAGTATQFTATQAQLENVTGQADQTASEYVSVGVLSAPFHGAGVDGVKWFDTNKDGSAISAASLLGYHAEGARTNNLLYSSELWRSSWVKSTSAGMPNLIVNGAFAADSDWTKQTDWTISGGTANVNTAAGVKLCYQSCALGAYKNYEVTYTVSNYVSGRARIVLYSADNTYGVTSYKEANGTYTEVIQLYIGGTSSNRIEIQAYSVGVNQFSVDDVIVREVTMQTSRCTGIDGAANSASTLTAGAADATILQTLSMAAAARSFSAYVKRRTGTGNVYITRDGGTNWTDITASLGASWTRVKIENTSVLNPVCGFKIATSGDAIDVDVCQDEAGSKAWSPIITTTAAVTRNADAETFPTASNWSDTAGWALATVRGESWANATGTAIGNGTNGLKLSASNSGVVAYDGTNTVNGPAGSPSGAEKLAMTWGSGALQSASGGVAGSAGSYDGAWGLATAGIGTSQGNVYIKDVYIGQSALTAAQLAQVTA